MDSLFWRRLVWTPIYKIREFLHVPEFALKNSTSYYEKTLSWNKQSIQDFLDEFGFTKFTMYIDENTPKEEIRKCCGWLMTTEGIRYSNIRNIFQHKVSLKMFAKPPYEFKLSGYKGDCDDSAMWWASVASYMGLKSYFVAGYSQLTNIGHAEYMYQDSRGSWQYENVYPPQIRQKGISNNSFEESFFRCKKSIASTLLNLESEFYTPDFLDREFKFYLFSPYDGKIYDENMNVIKETNAICRKE